MLFFGLTNTLLFIIASAGFQSQFTSPSFMPIKFWKEIGNGLVVSGKLSILSFGG